MHTLDGEQFGELLRTDLMAAFAQLKEIFSLSEIADGDIELDELPGLGLSQVERHNEGDGNYMYAVVEFTLDGQSLGFIRMGGTYSSWDASEWDGDDVTLVVPKHVVTLEYIAADGSEDKDYVKVLG